MTTKRAYSRRLSGETLEQRAVMTGLTPFDLDAPLSREAPLVNFDDVARKTDLYVAPGLGAGTTYGSTPEAVEISIEDELEAFTFASLTGASQNSANSTAGQQAFAPNATGEATDAAFQSDPSSLQDEVEAQRQSDNMWPVRHDALMATILSVH